LIVELYYFKYFKNGRKSYWWRCNNSVIKAIKVAAARNAGNVTKNAS